MKAREALRVLHVGGQRCDRQRRCVAGHDGRFGQEVFELGDECLFDREVFHHGFNHDMAWGQVVEVFGGFQATAEILNLLISETAFFLQLLPLPTYRSTGFFSRPWNDIEHQHLGLRLGGHLRDALSHGTCTDHPNVLRFVIHSKRLCPSVYAG